MTKHAPTNTSAMRVGLAGFGVVGQEIATRLLRGDIPGMELTAVSARDLKKAAATLSTLGGDSPVVSLEELVARSDIVCECATAEAFPDIARMTLKAGKVLIAVSVANLPGSARSGPDLRRQNSRREWRLARPGCSAGDAGGTHQFD